MRKNRKIIFAVSLSFLLSLHTGAYPFDYKGLDVKIRGSVSEAYDDNITFAETNEKDDFITNLSLGLAAKYEGKTGIFELKGDISQHYFKDYSSFDYNSQDITASFLKELSKYERFTFKDVFTHGEEPRSFEDAFGRTTGRYSFYRNRLGLGFAKDITRQWSVSARYSNQIDEFSRKDLADSSFNSAGLETDYALSSDLSVLGSYDYSIRDFEPGSHAYKHTLAAGATKYMTKQLYVDAKTGLDFLTSYNGKNYVKPVILVSLTNDINQSTSGSVSFQREYLTNAYSQDLFKYWQVTLAFTKQLLERLKGSLSGFYGSGEYISLDVTDNLRGIDTALTYDFRDNIKGNLRFSFSDADSNVATREYTKNTVSIGLTVEF